MIGYKDVLLDLPDSEYEKAVCTLADDAEAFRQWTDEMTEHYSNNERNQNDEH